MEFIHHILLGLVQGLTEFLPISSSAHLILLPNIAGWDDQGLVYDVAAHFGSLIAVIAYFRNDLKRITLAWVESLKGKPASVDSNLMWYLIIATIPIAFIAFILYSVIATWFRSPVIIAVATIFFGLLLWWADSGNNRFRKIGDINIKDALWIGFAQVLALIPGTSRSGITITAGLVLGLERQAAAKFSFLLAIPTILLAGGYEIYRYFINGVDTNLYYFSIVFFISACSAWCAIKIFFKFLERLGMVPYVIYRLILGTLLLYLYL